MSVLHIALDLGATKVACAIGAPLDGRTGYELIGSSLMPYPASSVTWPDDPLTIGRTIERALEATAVTGEFLSAHLAVSHPRLRAQTVQAAIALSDEPLTIRGRDIDRLTRAALTQMLGVDRDALAVELLGCSGNGFDDVRDPRGLAATRLIGRFHAVTMPIAFRRLLTQAVEFAGLEAASFTYSLQADAALDTAQAASRCLLIGLGGISTDVGLFVDGRLTNTQIVPWGGLTFAQQLAQDLQLTFEQATTLTLQGSGSRRAEVRRALDTGLHQIERAIRHVLKHQPLPERVLVTGRGALIDGFVEWVERVTSSKAAVCRNSRIQASDLARHVGFNTAIGLLDRISARATRPAAVPVRLVNRVLSRTKILLTEYF